MPPEARTIFHWMNSIPAALLVVAILARYRRHLGVGLAGATLVASCLRGHPDYTDFALSTFFAGLVLWRVGARRRRGSHWLLTAGLLVWPPLVAPVAYYAWAIRGAFNANFVLASALALGVGTALGIWTLLRVGGGEGVGEEDEEETEQVKEEGDHESEEEIVREQGHTEEEEEEEEEEEQEETKKKKKTKKKEKKK